MINENRSERKNVSNFTPFKALDLMKDGEVFTLEMMTTT